MPLAAAPLDPAILRGFVGLAGAKQWRRRVEELTRRAGPGSLTGRAAQRRHALELTLARLTDPSALAGAGPTERRILAYAREAVRVAAELPAHRREAMRARLVAGLSGEGSLIPLFHLLRVAALQRARGFAVAFPGLAEGAPHDLLIERDGVSAEVVCETVSAEEGRPLHRGAWCALVDAINPELQTWLAAHPGRYLLKMTLPEGVRRAEAEGGAPDVPALHRRIVAMLASQKRQDSAADAVLKLDPLLLAGAQAQVQPASLRAQFGPDAHLAVTQAGGSVFVMAARSGQENEVERAVCRRLEASAARLSGDRPGLLAAFLDDLDGSEWREMRERLTLEGSVRRFLTGSAARRVVAVTCASRQELFAASPDAAPEGELRFRNPSHPAAKVAALSPAIASSV